MDAQPNRNNRRRRGRKGPNKKPAVKIEPVIALARRPDSPRLEKPTRRMKAASAKPRTEREESVIEPRASLEEAPKKRREARIVQRKEDEIDDNERNRRRLLSRYMQAEGRAAITREADTYFQGGFQFPREQDVQLKLLEHFDEARAAEALATLAELLDDEAPLQLPIFRQRVRRIEEHADDLTLRETAAQLRRRLPA